ncbi:MAG: multiple sugar transport system substrate-binding protein [Paraglaciecola sp.]|jgi:multiple sugar transport system substrate-binding protein
MKVKFLLALVTLTFLLMQWSLSAAQQPISVPARVVNETKSAVFVGSLRHWQSTTAASLLRYFGPEENSDVIQDDSLDVTPAILPDNIEPYAGSAIDNRYNNASDVLIEHDKTLLQPLYMSSVTGLRGTFFASNLMQQIYHSIGYHISVARYATLQESLNSYLLGADGELVRAEAFTKVTPLLVRVPEPLITTSVYLVCKLQETCAQLLPKDTKVGVSSEIVVVEQWAKTNQLLTQRYPSFKKLLGAFSRGEIDFLILGVSDIFANQAELSTSTYRTILTIPFYHYVHKKHSALVPLIDRALKTFKMTDKYQQLQTKYWLHDNR